MLVVLDIGGVILDILKIPATRLRSGVVRDLERQNQKKENVRLLEEQIALTKRLIEERDKALMEKRSQQP
ncbi:protein PET117 homolog, mitochondrial [Geospiza fortis]|uniref:Protein PET117 homolog, mitochondrial n=1 Tax=Geospiza fortis TaxID=48883 RepID=A0A8N5I1M6_GEOFO|nr:protein PET117 homolog, mitochondrial [Geospiza fortis]